MADLVHALLHIVKDRHCRLEQRPTILGRFDTVSEPVEKADPERSLKLGNRVRYSRLGDREAGGGLRHAAALRHRQKGVEIAELEPATNAGVPCHEQGPNKVLLYAYPKIRLLLIGPAHTLRASTRLPRSFDRLSMRACHEDTRVRSIHARIARRRPFTRTQ